MFLICRGKIIAVIAGTARTTGSVSSIQIKVTGRCWLAANFWPKLSDDYCHIIHCHFFVHCSASVNIFQPMLYTVRVASHIEAQTWFCYKKIIKTYLGLALLFLVGFPSDFLSDLSLSLDSFSFLFLLAKEGLNTWGTNWGLSLGFLKTWKLCYIC